MDSNSINIENNETESDGEDKIDKQLRKTLAPLQFIDFLNLNSRYHITKNRITTKNKVSIFLTVLGTIILIYEKGYELYVLMYKNQLCWYKSVGNFSMFFDIFFYTFGYIFNTATLIRTREKNASLIVKVNKIYKALNVKKKFKFHMIFIILIYFPVHYHGQNRSIMYHHKYFTKGTEMFAKNYCLFLLSSFDFNIVFAICIMKLLNVLMVTWTSKIKKCADEACAKQLYEHYVSVMDAYKTYNAVLQNMILFHNLDVIIHQLMHMAIFVEIFAYNKVPVEAFVVLLLLLIIVKSVNSFVIEALLVYECERFYAVHDDAIKECQVLLKHTESDHVKMTCKNIRRVAINEFNKITICKLYEIDVQYLQGVAMLFANYLLVIMQFENLKFTSWERFNATIHSPNFTAIDNDLE